jgi:hypothetical protein
MILYLPSRVGTLTNWYHSSFAHRGGDPLNKCAPRSYLVTEFDRRTSNNDKGDDKVHKLRVITTHMVSYS